MANEVKAAFDTAFRDFVTDGVPSSGANDVRKSDVRAAGAAVQSTVDSLNTRVASAEEAVADIPDIQADTATALANSQLALDTVNAGIKPDKAAVRVLATANVTIASELEDGDTLDGVTLATGDRVALTGQTAPAENGVYVVAASGAASRATDMDASDEILRSRFTVSEGTHAGEAWSVQNTSAITVGTTAIVIAMTTPSSPVSAEVVAARAGDASLGDRLDADKAVVDGLGRVIGQEDTGVVQALAEALGAIGFEWDPASGLSVPGMSVSAVLGRLLQMTAFGGAVGLEWNRDGVHLPGMSVSLTTDNLLEVTVNGFAVVMYIDGDGQMHSLGGGASGTDIPDGSSQTIATTWVEPWNDASTDAVVSWVSNSQAQRTVFYRMDGGNVWSPVASQWTREWPWSGGRWIHSALIRDLSPATVYDIGWPGAELRRTFRTSARQNVNIAFASDWHQNASSLVTASAGVIAEQPDLIVLPGDLVGDNNVIDATTEASYILFFEQLATYWTRDGAMVPLVMLIGNHELGSGVMGPIKDISSLAFDPDVPRRLRNSTYRVDIGKEVAIIAVDTQWAGVTVEDQMSWIEAQLADAYATHRHIVVTGHSPAFGVSATNPAFDTDLRAQQVRYLLWPAMTDYADKVRFYVCGHEHMMVATAPLTTHYDSGLTDEENYYRWTTVAENSGVRQIGSGPIGGDRLELDSDRCALVSSIDGSVRIEAAYGEDDENNPKVVGDIISPTANRWHYWVSAHNSDGSWSAKAKSVDGSIIYEITP